MNNCSLPLNTLSNPFELFEFCFQEAIKARAVQPEAMVLSTAARNGYVSSRLVLYRGLIRDGFSFYTNYNSHKCNELSENPNASLLFYWQQTGRQLRIDGHVEKLKSKESDEYWNQRPDGHKISALASDQSSKINSLEELRKHRDDLIKKFSGKTIARPSHWGGYHLLPRTFEFWKLGEDRFHERVLFEKNKQDSWVVSFLSP